MSNFLKKQSQVEERLGEYANRILRIEAHLNRGEHRAARARLNGLLDELEDFLDELEFPIETTIIGVQLGFFSGKGSLLRGRLPAAVIGGAAGWLYGQSSAQAYCRRVFELLERVEQLHGELSEAASQTSAE
jgi:hypothetical protein